MYAHCGSSLGLRSSHSHLHVSCALWALLLISSTSPFTSSLSSSSPLSPCCSCCPTSTSLVSWINTLRTSAGTLAPWPRMTPPQKKRGEKQPHPRGVEGRQHHTHTHPGHRKPTPQPNHSGRRHCQQGGVRGWNKPQQCSGAKSDDNKRNTSDTQRQRAKPTKTGTLFESDITIVCVCVCVCVCKEVRVGETWRNNATQCETGRNKAERSEKCETEWHRTNCKQLTRFSTKYSPRRFFFFFF